MTRTSATAKVWRFALTDGEKEALDGVLRCYPAVPPGHQPLSRNAAEVLGPEDRHLLDEALEEQRQAHRKHVQRWRRKPGRLRRKGKGWELELAVKDVEWLLQVLNDVRVGQWIKLGSPDSIENPIPLFAKDGEALVLMELAGMFQMALLDAMDTPAPDLPPPV